VLVVEAELVAADKGLPIRDFSPHQLQIGEHDTFSIELRDLHTLEI
jgi:hypothetical protein